MARTRWISPLKIISNQRHGCRSSDWADGSGTRDIDRQEHGSASLCPSLQVIPRQWQSRHVETRQKPARSYSLIPDEVVLLFVRPEVRRSQCPRSSPSPPHGPTGEIQTHPL